MSGCPDRLMAELRRGDLTTIPALKSLAFPSTLYSRAGSDVGRPPYSQSAGSSLSTHGELYGLKDDLMPHTQYSGSTLVLARAFQDATDLSFSLLPEYWGNEVLK